MGRDTKVIIAHAKRPEISIASSLAQRSRDQSWRGIPSIEHVRGRGYKRCDNSPTAPDFSGISRKTMSPRTKWFFSLELSLYWHASNQSLPSIQCRTQPAKPERAVV